MKTGFLVAASIALLLAGRSSSFAEGPAYLPIAVSPTAPEIRYVGRFDRSDSAGPRCSWSASRVVLRFQGAAMNAVINDTSDNDSLQIVVDGKPHSVLPLRKGIHTYSLFQDAKSAPHTIELVRRTEPFVGVTQFMGFQLFTGSKLLPAPAAPKRRIEVIGDSISCGYGNEGKSKEEKFTPATENAYLTYGSIASRAVGADYVCLAWSGRKMYPDNTMDEVYGRTIATDPSSTWDFSKWTPDVVVITLGTNDLNGGIKDPKAWVAGYRTFLAKVHKNYPKAAIYCATSPMAWGDQVKLLRSCLDDIIAGEKAAGYKNVRILEFATQDAKDGYGSDWHPNVTTQTKMSQVLLAALEKDLGWKAN